MSLKKFILSKVFLKNLGYAVVILVVSVMILLIWLNFYTRHGQARSVPDFFGLNMQQTARLAKKNRLRYQVIDSVYTTLVPSGCVAEQNPKPGFKVKKWRNIVLTLNAYNPEMVAVPNLVGLGVRQALSLIESSGLKMGESKYRPDMSINVVLEQLYNGQKILPDDSVQKGSVVDLVLGKGLSNELTSVPFLVGMHLGRAKNKILLSSLNLGGYIYDNTVINKNDTLNALVYKQKPEYKLDASMQLGSTIYLFLTVDKAKLQADSTLLTISDTISTVAPVSRISN